MKWSTLKEIIKEGIHHLETLPLEHWQSAGTSPQEHQNLHLLVQSALSAIQCPPPVNSRAWELRTLKTSASSNLGILALEGCMNPQTRRVCYT